MHIRVHIEVSEKGYAYGDDPSGVQDIDLEVSDVLAGKLRIGGLLKTAVKLAIKGYKGSLVSTAEGDSEEVLQ